MPITRKTNAAPVALPPAASQAVAPQYPQQTYAPPATYVNGQAEGVDFMDLGFYTGGDFTVPQGAYCIIGATVRLFKGEKEQPGTERLGVMVTFIPLGDPREESKREQFYSLGSGAKHSFMPNADGTGIVPIPGAPGANAYNSTNWFLFLKSMYDCGLPRNLGSKSTKIVEGAWVYIVHVDEPEERSTFQSKTAEVQQAPRQKRKIAVVGEILQGGMPWAGGGGWPDKPVIIDHVPAAPATHQAPPQVAPPVYPYPAAPQSAVGAGVVPVAPVPAPPVGSMDLRTDTMTHIYDVIATETKQGRPQVLRAKLRNDVFNSMSAKLGEAAAGAALQTIFDAPGVLETVIGDLGYKINGAMVVPA